MSIPNPEDSRPLAYLRQQSYWAPAMRRLEILREERGTVSAQDARAYAQEYDGRRAAMIFDVVASQRAMYSSVRRRATTFQERWPNQTVEACARGNHDGLSLPNKRWQTVRNVAMAFCNYRQDLRLGDATDDAVVIHWARAVEPIRRTPRLDPYCGSVQGIGVALFAYLRMRCGADAIKPDGRVRTRLKSLGFPTSGGALSWQLVCEAAAEDLAVSRLHLDQLLWAEEPEL